MHSMSVQIRKLCYRVRSNISCCKYSNYDGFCWPASIRTEQLKGKPHGEWCSQNRVGAQLGLLIAETFLV